MAKIRTPALLRKARRSGLHTGQKSFQILRFSSAKLDTFRSCIHWNGGFETSTTKYEDVLSAQCAPWLTESGVTAWAVVFFSRKIRAPHEWQKLVAAAADVVLLSRVATSAHQTCTHYNPSSSLSVRGAAAEDDSSTARRAALAASLPLSARWHATALKLPFAKNLRRRR